jgi:hypothetical protein
MLDVMTFLDVFRCINVSFRAAYIVKDFSIWKLLKLGIFINILALTL